MDDIFDAVKKKAFGCTVTEKVTEYDLKEGSPVMVKQRIIEKEVPPDLAAIKLLQEGLDDDYSDYTEEQLLAEKSRLISMLKECED